MTQARRRAQGEGGVYQRASDGLWVGSLNLGTINGKRRRKTVYGKTQREAIAALAEVRKAAERGQDLTQRTPTVAQWFDEWIKIKESDGTRASTIRSYRWLAESHIKPALGQHRLDKLTPGHIRSLLTTKSESDLSAASVAHILRLLRNMLGEAERLDLVPRNVAKAVRMPKVPRFEAAALDVAGARSLIAALDGHRLEALFLTTLVLGLRRGEVLGLCWGDVDFDSQRVRIRQSLQRLNGSLQLVDTKTRRSNATVAAPPGLMEALKQHRRRQQEERLAMGSHWPGHDLVFTSTTGTPLEPRNVTRAWSELRVQANLPDLRFHDLRHSCATILTALGMHPRVVMEMLRHSQISITMDTYAHVAPALQREAADALEAALFA